MNNKNEMKYFFISDEHYSHTNIIKYCNRPFKDVKEMDDEIIKRHNEVVSSEDIVVHAGDFTLRKNKREADNYIRRLNGKHIFIRGSHDYWMDDTYHEIWEKQIGDNYIVVCHYPMKVWAKSHYNSWQLFGHSHGKLEGVGKQMDIGVDTHNFYPYSLDEIRTIMKTKPDNSNLLCT